MKPPIPTSNSHSTFSTRWEVAWLLLRTQSFGKTSHLSARATSLDSRTCTLQRRFFQKGANILRPVRQFVSLVDRSVCLGISRRDVDNGQWNYFRNRRQTLRST